MGKHIDQGNGRRIVLAITGASGAIYGWRLLNLLLESAVEVHVVVSPHGAQVLLCELGIERIDPADLPVSWPGQLRVHGYDDLGAPLASGSFRTEAMVICPCSLNTLGSVAGGRSDNLISRAGQVHLKEARRLVLCVRETPLSSIDLENMLRVSRAGAVVAPAMPGFYAQPRTIEELVDQMVGKLMDVMGIEHDLCTRWGQ